MTFKKSLMMSLYKTRGLVTRIIFYAKKCHLKNKTDLFEHFSRKRSIHGIVNFVELYQHSVYCIMHATHLLTTNSQIEMIKLSLILAGSGMYTRMQVISSCDK